MMVCHINKNRFQEFIKTLELRKQELVTMEQEGSTFTLNIGNKNFVIEFYTVTYDGNNFVGGNGNWAEVVESFKSNKK
jgi:hypothetical protein